MPGDLQTLVDLFAHPGFLTGLSVGLFGAVLFAGAALASRRRLVGWALLLSVAVVVGLAIQGQFTLQLVSWLGLLAGAGLTVDLAHALGSGRWGVPLRLLAWGAVVAAVVWFGVVAGVGEPVWARYVMPVAVLALASGLWLSGRHPIGELAGPMVALIVAGTWVTVPETDVFTVLVGAVLPFALVTLRPIGGRPSMTGAMAFAGLFTVLSLSGGAVRPWTVAAAWAAGAGLLLVVGAVWMRERQPHRLLILVVHVLFVVAITRVADHTDSELVVSLWLLPLIAVAGLAVIFGPGTKEGIS